MYDINQYPQISDSVQKAISSHLFEYSENGLQHNAYDQEFREQTSIEKGDLDSLEKSLKEDLSGVVGRLSQDELRHWKNIGIVVITLSSRSAIRGGLAPEIAYSLSDTFINELEKRTDHTEIVRFVRACEYQFCRMVYETNLQKNGRKTPQKHPYVKQCKDYIFSHLHDKITVQILADELHVNKNYLSDVFRKNEGVALSEYIMQEKLNRAKNLLKYSDYSYIEIASYLGFSSQSHLGTQFKKHTGYTLNEYRLLYK